MREYLGQNGNAFYIINQDYDEAASFDIYGHELESNLTATRAVSNCISVEPVDVISLLGTSLTVVGSDYSEIYFNGKSASLSMPYLTVFAKIKKGIRSIGGRYYFRKSEGYSQVLLTVKKDTVTEELLSELIGIKLSWKSLN